TLTLGAGGFTVLAGANLIDLTGSQDFTNPNVITGGGGTFTVMSDGDVTVGGPIAVDGTTANAQGGTICLNAGRFAGTAVVTSGSITVTAVLSATARVNGCGGTVNLGATGVAGS